MGIYSEIIYSTNLVLLTHVNIAKIIFQKSFQNKL